MAYKFIKKLAKRIIPVSMLTPILKRKQEKALNKQRERFHAGCQELLYRVDDILSQAGIPYWLNYGTLLGAYRDNDFIPHDYDLDIGLMMEYQEKVKKLMCDNGLTQVFEAHMGGAWDEPEAVEYRFEYNGVCIDFNYYFEKECGTVSTYDFVLIKNVNYNSNMGKRNPIIVEGVTSPLSGLRKIVFRGREFAIPDNTEDYLVANYGPSWRVPVKDFDYHDYAKNIKVYKMGEIYGEVIIYK